MPQNLPVCPSPLVLDFNENNFIGCPQSVCWALFLHKVINSMSFRLSTFPSQTLHKKTSERMFYWSALGHCRIQKDSNFTYKNHLLLSWKSRSVSIDKILSSQEKNELSKTMLKRIYKPQYDYQNFSPFANGTDLNRQKYTSLGTHWH